jgi:hypothetical protein
LTPVVNARFCTKPKAEEEKINQIPKSEKLEKFKDQSIQEEPKIAKEEKAKPTPQPIVHKKKPRRFRNFMMLLFLLGGVFGTLEYMQMANKNLKDQKTNEPVFLDENKKDAEFVKLGKEERIRQIREALEQQVIQDFKIPLESLDEKVQKKQNEIVEELEKLIKLDVIKESHMKEGENISKYAEVAKMLEDLKMEIEAKQAQYEKKYEDSQIEVEKLSKIKHIIEQEMSSLKSHLEEVDSKIDEIKVTFAKILEIELEWILRKTRQLFQRIQQNQI